MITSIRAVNYHNKRVLSILSSSYDGRIEAKRQEAGRVAFSPWFGSIRTSLPKVATITHSRCYSKQSLRCFSAQINHNDDCNDSDPTGPDPLQANEELNRTSLLMELTDRVGILHDVLRFFWKYDVNITRIESRPCTKLGKFDFFVDLQGIIGDKNVDSLIRDLKLFQGLDKLLILDKKEGNSVLLCFATK